MTELQQGGQRKEPESGVSPDIKIQYNSLLHENLRHVFVRTVDDEYYVRVLSFRNNLYKEIFPESVPLFSFVLPADAPIYMEGYQMLSHIGGTASRPVQLGRMNEQKDLRVLKNIASDAVGFNYMLVKIDSFWYLLGAVSCERTYISFRLKNCSVEVFWEMSGAGVAPRSEFSGEKICLLTSSDRQELLDRYGALVARSHRPRRSSPVSGWCSWYAYYDKVTQQDVLENLDLMKNDWPELEYLQIDDGYQIHMGDWMIPSDRFTGGLEALCEKIRAAGRKPGIWVAPFIASGDSLMFRQHPDWFVQGPRNRPLAARDVTYGGWRDGAWYMPDFSVSEARDYISEVFSWFRHRLGIDYFKLDALFWGAIPGMKFRRQGMTACEHFRLGMSAIRKAVGEDSYILGCNAPLWPSLGLFEAQRVTDDVERRSARIHEQKTQADARSWMSGRLWFNDVDCMVHSGVSREDAKILEDMLLESRGPMLVGDALADAGERMHDLARRWRDSVSRPRGL
ncbi:MAG: alpha-galactosidase [Succinivibrionaceae bacterium]|nr:alpha-galactosidase [Succinivibrionaceae bacterium]